MLGVPTAENSNDNGQCIDRPISASPTHESPLYGSMKSDSMAKLQVDSIRKPRHSPSSLHLQASPLDIMTTPQRNLSTESLPTTLGSHPSKKVSVFPKRVAARFNSFTNLFQSLLPPRLSSGSEDCAENDIGMSPKSKQAEKKLSIKLFDFLFKKKSPSRHAITQHHHSETSPQNSTPTIDVNLKGENRSFGRHLNVVTTEAQSPSSPNIHPLSPSPFDPYSEHASPHILAIPVISSAPLYQNNSDEISTQNETSEQVWSLLPSSKRPHDISRQNSAGSLLEEPEIQMILEKLKIDPKEASLDIPIIRSYQVHETPNPEEEEDVESVHVENVEEILTDSPTMALDDNNFHSSFENMHASIETLADDYTCYDQSDQDVIVPTHTLASTGFSAKVVEEQNASLRENEDTKAEKVEYPVVQINFQDKVDQDSDSKASPEDGSAVTELAIETENPWNLFWVPAHLHPELHPNDFKKWISAHWKDNVNSTDSKIQTHRKVPLKRAASFVDRHVVVTADNVEDWVESEVSKTALSPSSKDVNATAKEDASVASPPSLSFPSTAVKRQGQAPLKRSRNIRRAKHVKSPMSDVSGSSSPVQSLKKESLAPLRRSMDSAVPVLMEEGGDPSVRGFAKSRQALRLGLPERSESAAHLRTTSTEPEEHSPVTVVTRKLSKKGASSIHTELDDSESIPETTSPVTLPEVKEQSGSSESSSSDDENNSKSHRHGKTSKDTKAKKKKWTWLMGLFDKSETPETTKKSDAFVDKPEENVPSPSKLINPSKEYDDDFEDAGLYPPDTLEVPPGRLSPQAERQVYRMSHDKLAQTRRPLHQQVMISNLMLYIISVHADVTLSRQGPRGLRKGKRGRRRKNKRNLHAGPDAPFERAKFAPGRGKMDVLDDRMPFSSSRNAKSEMMKNPLLGPPIKEMEFSAPAAESSGAEDDEEDDVPLGVLQKTRRSSVSTI